MKKIDCYNKMVTIATRYIVILLSVICVDQLVIIHKISKFPELQYHLGYKTFMKNMDVY